LEGFSIGAADGTIGKVKDFYFDVEAWVFRYVVANTNVWLGREVLLSPQSIGQADWEGKVLPVTITKEQVKNSPSIDTDEPISRQYESSYLGYYGYPYYWGGTEDAHLRSCNAVMGYHIHARDGDIGHVKGFLADDYLWSVHFSVRQRTVRASVLA